MKQNNPSHRYLKARLITLARPSIWGTLLVLSLLGWGIIEYTQTIITWSTKPAQLTESSSPEPSPPQSDLNSIRADIDNIPAILTDINQANKTKPIIITPPKSNTNTNNLPPINQPQLFPNPTPPNNTNPLGTDNNLFSNPFFSKPNQETETETETENKSTQPNYPLQTEIDKLPTKPNPKTNNPNQPPEIAQTQTIPPPQPNPILIPNQIPPIPTSLNPYNPLTPNPTQPNFQPVPITPNNPYQPNTPRRFQQYYNPQYPAQGYTSSDPRYTSNLRNSSLQPSQGFWPNQINQPFHPDRRSLRLPSGNQVLTLPASELPNQ